MKIREYTDLDKLKKDIADITIQGATNVAIATIHGLILYCEKKVFDSWDQFIKEVKEVGEEIANIRLNEPLAKNGIKYILYMLKTRYRDADTPELRKDAFMTVANEYLEMIDKSKKLIEENGFNTLKGISSVFTHCHSSTSEHLIVALSKMESDFKVVCTETRPRFQGRITATHLVEEGVDTTLIADSAADAYIIGRGNFPVDAILIGADEISVYGDVINKVGSWGIALSAYYANKPIYVVTPFLKVNSESAYKPFLVERRDGSEIWDSPPKGLKIDNPAFDIIDGKLISGYITELGVITAQEIPTLIREKYGWVY